MSQIDLYVRDKMSGKIHKVGDDPHDALWVDSSGTVHYFNLQNGDGCSVNSHTDEHAGYEFIPNSFVELYELYGHYLIEEQLTRIYPKDPCCPCDFCAYNPPSSFDGKPCACCPAEQM